MKIFRFICFLFLCLSFVYSQEINLFLGFEADTTLKVALGLPFITGDEGSSILGSKNLELGATNVYFGRFNTPNLVGTVSTTANSDTLTGSGTAFTSLKIGDWLSIAGITSPVQIKTITNATSIVLTAPVTIAVSTATFKKVDCMNLGTYDKLSFKLGQKKVDLKDAQGGDNASDKVQTGYTCDIEFGMARTSMSRLEFTMAGFKVVRDAVTGLIKGAGFGFAIGTKDSDNLGQLKLVKLVGGVESTDPMDTVTILKASPNVDAEWTYDTSTQRYTKNMFTGYVDHETLIDGVPMIAIMGDIT